MGKTKNILTNLKQYYWKHEKYFVWGLAAVLLSLYFLNLNQYAYRILTMIGLYSILALSLNIVLGFTGMLSLGHAAFYSIGAYVGAILQVKHGANFFVSAILGAITAGFFGFLLGLPTMRLSGSYLAITTMGFAEVVRMVLLSWESVTNGAFGIQNIPRPQIFGYQLTTVNGGIYLLVLVVLIAAIYFCVALDSSKLGRTFRAIKNDDFATTMMGVNINRYKVIAFTLAAAMAGLAGTIFASMNRYIDPNTFNFDTSMLIVCICILGGMGSIKGQLLGAVLLVSFPEVLRSLSIYRFVVYGIILIVMMRFRPQGILGTLSSRPYKFPPKVVVKQSKNTGGEIV